MALAIERYANLNVSVKAGFVKNFSKIFVVFRKVDLSPKLLEKFWFPFDISLARELIYNFANSD